MCEQQKSSQTIVGILFLPSVAFASFSVPPALLPASAGFYVSFTHWYFDKICLWMFFETFLLKTGSVLLHHNAQLSCVTPMIISLRASHYDIHHILYKVVPALNLLRSPLVMLF